MNTCQSKQTVLMVHNHYKQPGGEDTVFRNEIQLLREHGHKVFIYTRDNNEIDQWNILQKIQVPFDNVFSIRTYLDIRRIIRTKHIDVVQVHNTMPLIGPAVYYAAKSLKVPVLQTVHNFRFLCPCGLLVHHGKICTDSVYHGLHCAVRDKCYHDSYVQTLAQVLSMKLHRRLGIYKTINFICLTEFNKKMMLDANNASRRKIFDPDKIFVKPNFAYTGKQ